jgi:hypothetical protein
MPQISKSLDPKLLSLLALFPGNGLTASDLEMVAGPEVPEPYKRLLVHRHHMTVTLESHHGAPVRLRVLERRRDGDDYARKLILTVPGPRAGAEKAVLSGVMRFDLSQTRPEVQEAIVSESAPLGRILIEHNVLRSIEPRAYLRVSLTPELRRAFGASPEVEATYGRVAIILCNHSPAVELLEIVSPEPRN